MTYCVELDVTYELTYQEVKDYALNFYCKAELVEEYGPAGGNPVYKFTCPDYNSIVDLATDVLYDEELAKECVYEI